MNFTKYFIGVFLLVNSIPSNAQLLKKIKKTVEKTVEQTVLNKSEEIAQKETSSIIDTVYDNAKKPRNSKKEISKKENQVFETEENVNHDALNSFGVYKKFTFEPGHKTLFFDNFYDENLGDFPSKWETAGNGEIVALNDGDSKWLSLLRRSGYYPTIDTKELPENYTIEFDLITNGYLKGNAMSKIYFAFLPKKSYSMGAAGSVASVEIVLTEYFKVAKVENFGNEAPIRVVNTIDRNRTDILNDKIHISIAVNGKRLRMWINEEKYVDSPNILQGRLGKHFLIEAFNVLPEKNHFVGITNFRIAEADEDFRSLLKKGKFSTTGIYFNSNTWQVKNESYVIIKNIAEFLKEDLSFKLKIIGHTDADGSEADNQVLSENRAKAIKQILVEQFGIEENRLITDGKGEKQPVDNNTTEQGKAKNRRVEFLKI